jgi:transcriptional regulator GlxA family with amidase domain
MNRQIEDSTPTPAAPVPLKVVMLVYDGANLLDISGPLQALQSCGFGPGMPRYQTVVASFRGGLVETAASVSIMTAKLDDLDPREFDTILVAGGSRDGRPIVPPEIVHWIEAAEPHARRICSICSGAFILAEAGLLEGRRATTHWYWANLLQNERPGVQVQPDSIFVNEGKIWTSAGVTAGIDLTLELIRQDYDHKVAIEAARRLVVFMKRPGGQAQFSVPLSLQSLDRDDFSELHAWMRENLAGDLRIEELARQAGMSERTFTRLYAERVGRTPAKTVEAMRAEAACSLLETTRLGLKQISNLTGFGDEQNLRRVFMRRFGLNPTDYRSRFGALENA